MRCLLDGLMRFAARHNITRAENKAASAYGVILARLDAGPGGAAVRWGTDAALPVSGYFPRRPGGPSQGASPTQGEVEEAGIAADAAFLNPIKQHVLGPLSGDNVPEEWAGEKWDDWGQTIPKKLLLYMHPRKSADISALCLAVWGGNSVTPSALQVACTKANEFLMGIKPLRQLHKKRGEPVLYWESSTP